MTRDQHDTPGGLTANSAHVSQHVHYWCVYVCIVYMCKCMCFFIMAVFQTEHVSKERLIPRYEA